jgi:hypothetical protein
MYGTCCLYGAGRNAFDACNIHPNCYGFARIKIINSNCHVKNSYIGNLMYISVIGNLKYFGSLLKFSVKKYSLALHLVKWTRICQNDGDPAGSRPSPLVNTAEGKLKSRR